MLPELSRAIRPFIPNVIVRVPHVEPGAHLAVKLRHHLGLIAHGAKAYERRYVDILRRCVEPGDCVFDVGANIGFYSVLFSRWVGRTGRVLAYEPDPENVRLLEKNVFENRCTETMVRPVALGRECGSCVFSRDTVTGLTGHVGTGPTYGGVRFRTRKEISIQVAVRTLDAEIETARVVPSVVKLDTEGGEYDILCGGVRALREYKPLIVAETSNWGHDADRGVTRSRACIELLNELGYVVFDLDAGRRVSPGDQTWMILAVPAKQCSEARVAGVLATVGKR